MKSRKEIVERLARSQYSSYMGGDMWPRCEVSLSFVAWTLDIAEDELYEEVEARYNAIIKEALAEYRAKYGDK